MYPNRRAFTGARAPHEASTSSARVSCPHRAEVAMHRLVAILALLVVAGGARAGVIPQLKTAPLSVFPTELDALDPGGVLDGVQVYLCDREPFGSFFLETAIVEGTLVLADTLTCRFGRALAAASAGAVEVSPSDPEQWPEAVERVVKDPGTSPDALSSLRDLGGRLEGLVGPLVRATVRAPGLASQIPALTQDVPAQYSGFTGKVKAMRVVRALGGSAGQLQNAAVHSEKTLRNVRAIVAVLQP